MANDIEKHYNELAKKHKLPKFNDVDAEFEISDFESANFLLRNTLRNIADKMEYYSNFINNLLQPDAASLSSMHETRFFTQEERNDVYFLFKKIMKCHRAAILLILANDEKKQADFLNSFFDGWIEIKKQLVFYIEKMKDTWDKDTSIQEDLGYLG